MPSFHPARVDTGHLVPFNVSTPFYYSDRPRCLPYLSDSSLVLLVPIITHWSIILLYRLFLFAHSPKGDQYTLKRQTVRLMVEIQIVQTIFGLVWLTRFGSKEALRDPAREMQAVGRLFGSVLPSLMGEVNAQVFLDRNGEELIQFAYWWAIPIARQFLASFIVDVWQAFLRFLHIDRYLYADVHAFLFDTIGLCLACSLSGITIREAIVLLVHSTLQTLGQPPRHTLPRSSLHPSLFLDEEATMKPGEHGSFIGFRQQLRQLVQWFILAVDLRFIQSRRLQRAIQTARQQQAPGQERSRPQLRLNTSFSDQANWRRESKR